MLAYDGSEPARTAVATVAELFGGRSAVVVHVWESPLSHSLTGQALSSATITEIRELTEGLGLGEILASSACEQAEEGADLARQRGLEVRAEAIESTAGVWRALIEAARRSARASWRPARAGGAESNPPCWAQCRLDSSTTPSFQCSSSRP